MVRRDRRRGPTERRFDLELRWQLANVLGIYQKSMSGRNPESRQVRLFRNNRNQAIRIPVGFELPGKEAAIRRDGDRLIIEPVPTGSLLELLASWPEIDEQIPNVARSSTGLQD
ncbi:antitoxin [Rhodopila sp.]|uniref:antitoxin n=1 Tax=Rhodopila sp. TaxID=2480087 RepID=UPI003D0FF2E5